MVSHHQTDSPTSVSFIRYCGLDTFLGTVFSAESDRGICYLAFESEKSGLEKLKKKFGSTHRYQRSTVVEDKLKSLFDHLEVHGDYPRFEVDLRGTSFQKRVWEFLRQIPSGSTLSYQEVAKKVGKPNAVRAVGSACARNPVGLLVPCHRVKRSNGELGGFAWGLELKKQILSLEQKAA